MGSCEIMPIYSRWELDPLKWFTRAVDNVKYLKLFMHACVVTSFVNNSPTVLWEEVAPLAEYALLTTLGKMQTKNIQDTTYKKWSKDLPMVLQYLFLIEQEH